MQGATDGRLASSPGSSFRVNGSTVAFHRAHATLQPGKWGRFELPEVLAAAPFCPSRSRRSSSASMLMLEPQICNQTQEQAIPLFPQLIGALDVSATATVDCRTGAEVASEY